MICFDFHNECTGCRACADICPKSCISFAEDNEGFIMPTVDKENCIDCHRCEQICPTLNNKVELLIKRNCYLVYHRDKEIRKIGSSGSVFYALAEYVIQNKGVVYAAALDENLQLKHSRATDMSGVLKQMKSKYIQSNTSGIYKQLIADLKDEKQVLFVGTPCQCQALHNMTSSMVCKKLIIIDMICHGVPSQYLFNQSILCYEKKHKCKVLHFSFREKTKDALRNYKIEFVKQKKKYTECGDLIEIPYCLGYFEDITQRNSCYKCKFRKIERVADITIGDFWGLEKIRPDIEDFKSGYSAVIINTLKGKNVLNLLSTCVIEEIVDGCQYVANFNSSYVMPINKSLKRYLFFVCLRHLKYPTCEKLFLQLHPTWYVKILLSLLIKTDRLVKKLS